MNSSSDIALRCGRRNSVARRSSACQPDPLLSRHALRPSSFVSSFQQPVTGFGVEIEMIDFFQIDNSPASLITERVTAIKRMQDDALQQITERQIVILSQRFQNLEQTFFYANSRLHPLDDNSLTVRCCFCCPFASHRLIILSLRRM